MSSSYLLFFVLFTVCVLPESIFGACWDTGCQLDSWAVRGCEQYGMRETGRRGCNGGIIYSCCDKKIDGGGSAINLPSGSGGDLTNCWDTGCQLSSWAVQGCAQYGRHETSRRSCNGGFIYTCCTKKGASGGGSRPISGSNSKHGDMTYYNLGLTACGRTYSNGDHVAALAFGHFTSANPNNDPMCGRRVKIIDPSSKKQVEVTVVDKCQACKMNDIDVSPSAFQQLKPLGVGRTSVKWNFI